MRSNFRPILAWLLLACFFLPAFVGQGLHALPGCDHGLHLPAQANADCHGVCPYSHDSHSKSKQNDADLLQSEICWEDGVLGGDDHDCLLCAFLAIAKSVQPISSPLPVNAPVLSLAASSNPGHYFRLCLSCSPRGPPAISCEKRV